MYDCECLIHPFQNDPGTSQSQRVMDELLSGAAKIDARTLADLLDYFVQLSRHINFYDTGLNVSDWQPFFKKSIPFVLASVIRNQSADIENNLNYYNSLFVKKPSSPGLQLEAYFIFYRFINKINDWQFAIAVSGLPVESYMQKLVKDKLSQPLKLFISYANAAAKYYGINKIDFSKLQDNDSWNLDLTDLYAIDTTFKTGTTSKFKRRNNLFENFKTIASPFIDAVSLISSEAEKSLQQSLLPLKDELQKKHPPHLGLLFAFLNIFRYLQDDLNSYTRKHLDFFYKDVLQIKSRDAVADKTHIIFEIQKQLSNYLIKKGLLVKDGKDKNKQQILFSLDDEIVVNKTEVTELRTLFVNNESAFEQPYVEGVYIANDATKADGISQDFPDGQPTNYPTLGAKLSKYSDPETKIIKPYANGRQGFILGSPVLYLQQGSTRSIEINLDCYLNERLCTEIASASGAPTDCCTKNNQSGITGENIIYPNFYLAQNFFTEVNASLADTYYYFNQDVLKQAIKKGIKSELVEKLREKFLLKKNKNFNPQDPLDYCTNCPAPEYKYEGLLNEADYLANFNNEKEILKDWINPRNPLTVLFSGEKEWIEPVIGEPVDPSNLFISLGTLNFINNKFRFTLTIKATLLPDKPAVTFYDKSKLIEDFDTTQPLVKIELDDKIKLVDIALKPKASQTESSGDCCLLKDEGEDIHQVSLYHFFRNVLIDANAAPAKVIKVAVCGLKKFIAQNDESVQDANGSVYPFGTRPDIIDFDVNHTIANTTSVPGYPNPLPAHLPNLIGPNFYIGSKEIFFKNWDKLCVNLNWKDKPVNFNEFYTAYIKREIDDPNNPGTDITILGLNESDFQVNLALLEKGKWQREKNTTGKGFGNTITGDYNRRLFKKEMCNNGCLQLNNFNYSFFVEANDFPGARDFFDLSTDLKKFDPSAQNGFIRFNLQNQDFLHKDYAYALARQMMAIGKFPDKGVEGAIYLDGNTVIVFKDTGSIIIALKSAIELAVTKAGATKTEADKIINQLGIVRDSGSPGGISITNTEFLSRLNTPITNTSTLAGDTKLIVDGIITSITSLESLLSIFGPDGKLKENLAVPIPNEPWTPIISNISLDYTASATLEDIGLIHLYPYAGTYKHEEIKLQPSLFPTFCDDGTLFVGLKNLVPGDNLNILFQLAEATSDSEAEKEEVKWHYLDSNVWKPLRKGFEVLEDASENLTTSGVIKFALPANMTKDNTIMSKDLHWIKASIAQNSKAVSETTGIYPQAIRATFTNDVANDKLRLSEPLAGGSISKLNVADTNVKNVQQPYDTFDGSIPEIGQQFYVRVSESLRHKGKAIQKFDYERLALEAFPQVFKAKCINHSFALDAHLYKNDFPYAPGYIILAVIPDLYKLKAGNSLEPKVPVSLIERIEMYFRKRTSPFVRFRAMNPRYEKINFCLRVKLLPGKDESYYREKLKQDIQELLAPWAVGKYDKLTFGQC
ncbi:MAG: hypothetical protein ABI683_06140, partial [Ginsengibacter sp.]